MAALETSRCARRMASHVALAFDAATTSRYGRARKRASATQRDGTETDQKKTAIILKCLR